MRADVSGILRRAFEKTKYWPAIVKPSTAANSEGLCFFAVDNKRGGADAGIGAVRQAMRETLRDHPIFQDEYPVAWLRVLDDALGLAKTRSTMAMAELARDVAGKYGIGGADAVADMAKAFHELGFVAYFNDPALPEIVLDPQRLIDAIAAVICNDVRSTGPGRRLPRRDRTVQRCNHTGVLDRADALPRLAEPRRAEAECDGVRRVRAAHAQAQPDGRGVRRRVGGRGNEHTGECFRP